MAFSNENALSGTGAGRRDGLSAHRDMPVRSPFARGKEARFMRSFEIEFVLRHFDAPCTMIACGGERAS
jgi:hypothetical protein